MLDNTNKSDMGCIDCTPVPYQQTELKNLQSIKLRAGVAVENSLVYLAAGPAWVNAEFKNDDNGWTGGTPSQLSETKRYSGIAYAMGLETNLSAHVALRFQGQVANVRQHVYEDKPKDAAFGDTSSVTNVSIGAAYKF